jgi:hypothetical protein
LSVSLVIPLRLIAAEVRKTRIPTIPMFPIELVLGCSIALMVFLFPHESLWEGRIGVVLFFLGVAHLMVYAPLALVIAWIGRRRKRAGNPGSGLAK